MNQPGRFSSLQEDDRLFYRWTAAGAGWQARSTGKTPGSVHGEVRALSLLTAAGRRVFPRLSAVSPSWSFQLYQLHVTWISDRINCPRLTIIITMRQTTITNKHLLTCPMARLIKQNGTNCPKMDSQCNYTKLLNKKVEQHATAHRKVTHLLWFVKRLLTLPWKWLGLQ